MKITFPPGGGEGGGVTEDEVNAIVGAAVSALDIFSTIAVKGQDDVVADNNDDTLTLVAGDGIKITTDKTADSITIEATGTGGSSDGFSIVAVKDQDSVVAEIPEDTLTLVAGVGIIITTDKDADSVTFDSYTDFDDLIITKTEGTHSLQFDTETDDLDVDAMAININGEYGLDLFSNQGPVAVYGDQGATLNSGNGKTEVIGKDGVLFNTGEGDIEFQFNGTTQLRIQDPEGGDEPSVVFEDSGSARLPTGTTAQRTVNATGGEVRYNSEEDTVEAYFDGGWQPWGMGGGGGDAFTTIVVKDNDDVVADSATDTLTLIAGTGIKITTDKDTDSITIESTVTDTDKDEQTAAEVPYDNKTSELTADDVQEAIDELDGRLDTAESDIGSLASYVSGLPTESFVTISVAGEDDVMADSVTDTLTLVASTGIKIETDKDADSITITNTAPNVTQNVFTKVAVADNDTIEADGATDTLTIVAGTGISITTDKDTDTIIITNTVADTDDQTAAEVAFTPAGNIDAKDVQAAIEELDDEKLAKALDARDHTSVTAAGSNQAGATALTTPMNTVDTATANQGVRLPASPALGEEIVVVNKSGVVITVYPGTSGTIDGGSVNAGVSVSNAFVVRYICTSATPNWEQQIGLEFVSGNPAALGTASPGTARTAARSDHVHEMPSAGDIGYDNTTSKLTATKVQTAIDEVEGRLDTAEGAITTLAGYASDHETRIGDLETDVGALQSTVSGLPTTAFTTFAVSGKDSVVADSASDTLTFVAGTGIEIDTDKSSDSITITATGGGGGNDFATVSVNGNESGDNTISATKSGDDLALYAGDGILFQGIAEFNLLRMDLNIAGLADTKAASDDKVLFFDTSNGDQPEYRSHASIVSDLGLPAAATNIEVFTSTNATWTIPTGARKLFIQAWGAGGSGGCGGASGSEGGGGGGGAYNEGWMDLVADPVTGTLNVVVGAGGAAVGTSGSAGNGGGDSSVSCNSGPFAHAKTITAYGGGGGGFSNAGGGGGGGGGRASAGANSATNGGAAGGGPIGGAAVLNAQAGLPSIFGGGSGAGATTSTNLSGGDSVYGGGGGGSGKDGASNTGKGGNSYFGGAGGGGGSSSVAAGPKGTSVYGGDGGDGGFDSNNGGDGSIPGGGGGGTEQGTSGAGARGEVWITAFF